MSKAVRVWLSIFLLCNAAACQPAFGQSSTAPGRRRLIVISGAKPPVSANATLLDVIRSRLPVRFAFGRFMTSDGESSVCLSSSRNRPGRVPQTATPNPAGLPLCDMLTLYVDGLLMSRPGDYLYSERVRHFESIELLSPTDAALKFGASATGGEALELWTRGKGPHARRHPPFDQRI